MMVEDYSVERINDYVVLCGFLADGKCREYKKYLPAENADKSPNRESTARTKKAAAGNNGSANPISLDREKVVFETETYVPDIDDDLDR